MTDRQLRDFLRSPGSGPHDALKKLLPTGLVKHAGKASTKNNPMQYEVTPLGEIDETRERYKVLAAQKPKRRARTSPGSRLAELRQMEQGDPRKWYQARDKILAALPLLTNTLRMSFWESVPSEELQLALEEIEELQEAAADALAAGRERMQHEKYKDKIAKMNVSDGRTEAEQDVARRKTEKLSRKLIQG